MAFLIIFTRLFGVGRVLLMAEHKLEQDNVRELLQKMLAREL